MISEKTETRRLEQIAGFLDNGNSKIVGVAGDPIRFVMNEQLLDTELWNRFVEVFLSKADSADKGWRGEYWGKMMRGGCLIYRVNADKNLYVQLKDAVNNLLLTQESNGRISSYTVETEFSGWDIWSRKYVLTGLFYFYDICMDEELKKRILLSAEQQLDYILAKIGPGKKSIFETSNWWKGLNSCTILEPVMEAYKKLSKKEYLAFAEYLIASGGCRDANLIKISLDNKLPPYQYPVKKAYEMMSYFEGVLAYAEETGDRDCFDAVKNFWSAVKTNEVTIIGGIGCDGELFSNSAINQTKRIAPRVMQETCVTVTWLRLCLRLFVDTGEAKYIDCLDVSALNALYGSLNINRNEQFSFERKKNIKGLPFDSYSPLSRDTRGRGIAGFKELSSGYHYGCCAAIGAAGVAIVALSAVMRYKSGILFNEYFDATTSIKASDGKEISFVTKGNYPVGDAITIEFNNKIDVSCVLYFREPKWCEGFEVCAKGRRYTADIGEISIGGVWKSGDVIEIKTGKSVKKQLLNGKTAYTYGPYVLAYTHSSKSAFAEFCGKHGNEIDFELIEPANGENINILIRSEKGEVIRLKDYASCGKKTYSEKISVWLTQGVFSRMLSGMRKFLRSLHH